MPPSASPKFFFSLTLLLGLLLLLAGFVPGRARQPATQPDAPKADKKSDPKQTQQASKYERPTDPSLYVGEETCKTCHADMPSKDFVKNFEGSPHFVTTFDTKKGPEWHGCEACHGPGKAHVDGGGDKTKIFTFKNASAREINARCLDCHAGGPQHMNAINSEHTKNDVSCISCHSPHHAKEPEFLLVKSQPELCRSIIG
jgi:predicted CXXCH cytochrome family protein